MNRKQLLTFLVDSEHLCVCVCVCVCVICWPDAGSHLTRFNVLFLCSAKVGHLIFILWPVTCSNYHLYLTYIALSTFFGPAFSTTKLKNWELYVHERG